MGWGGIGGGSLGNSDVSRTDGMSGMDGRMDGWMDELDEM